MNKRGFNRRVSKLSDLKEYKNNRHWKLLGGSSWSDHVPPYRYTWHISALMFQCSGYLLSSSLYPHLNKTPHPSHCQTPFWEFKLGKPLYYNHLVTLYGIQFTGLACGLILPNSTMTLLGCTKSQKYGQNHEIWALYGQFSLNARIQGHARTAYRGEYMSKKISNCLP